MNKSELSQLIGPAPTVASCDTSANVQARADFVCDGVNDEVEINAAMSALKQGGTVTLSEGTFHLSAPIDFNGQDALSLVGSGTGERVDSSVDTTAVGTRLLAELNFAGQSIIKVKREDRPVANASIRHLTVDGKKLLNPSVDGIYFSSFRGLLDHVTVTSCTGDGIVIEGAQNWNCYDTALQYIISAFNLGAGLHISKNAPDLHLIQVIAHSNRQDGMLIESSHLQALSLHSYDNEGNGIFFNNAGSWSKLTNVKVEVNGKHGLLIDAATADIPDISLVQANFRQNSQLENGKYNDVCLTSSTGSKFIYRPLFQAIQFTPGPGNKPGYNLSIYRTQSGTFQFTYDIASYVNSVVQDNGLSSLINGCGMNIGNPTSVGNWATRAREGAMVRDVNTNKWYIYQAGVWRAMA